VKLQKAVLSNAAESVRKHRENIEEKGEDHLAIALRSTTGVKHGVVEKSYKHFGMGVLLYRTVTPIPRYMQVKNK